MTTPNRTIYPALEAIVARYRLVIGAPLVAGVLTALVVMILPPTFVSTASFVPENPGAAQLPTGVLGAAAQLGITLNPQNSRSPAFYADLVRSGAILAQVLESRITGGAGRDSITTYDLYRVSAKNPQVRLEDGLKILRRRMAAEVDPRTDVVRLSVEAPSAQAAHDVAGLLLARLTRFNLTVRQSAARQRREFIEGRVAEMQADLQRSEDSLRAFLERNRTWQSSPQLSFEQQRLSRQATIRQDLYATLRHEYETARIEEVNTTPVLTIIDQPSLPGRRARPQRTFTVLIVTTIVGMLACGLALVLEHFRALREAGDPEYLRFHQRVAAVGLRLHRRQPDHSAVSSH